MKNRGIVHSYGKGGKEKEEKEEKGTLPFLEFGCN
jgi:hypothetical protein